MADLKSLQARFPHYKIRSQPAPGCTCNDGICTTKDGRESPCLCVCVDAPEPGEPEYRVDACKALGAAAKKALSELRKAI